MIEVSWVIFIIQLVSSFMMIGIAWLIQVINYPLFRSVPDAIFKEYHKAHLQKAQMVIIPLMLLELVSGGYLLLWPLVQVKYSLYLINFLLIVFIWLITFFMHVPTHRRLQLAHSKEGIEKLIRWSWLRTIAWSVHGLLLIFILY